MKMIECYDCKSKVPEIVLIDIDGKAICPECEKKRCKIFKEKNKGKTSGLKR